MYFIYTYMYTYTCTNLGNIIITILSFHNQKLLLSHRGEVRHTLVLDQKPGFESQHCH